VHLGAAGLDVGQVAPRQDVDPLDARSLRELAQLAVSGVLGCGGDDAALGGVLRLGADRVLLIGAADRVLLGS